MSLPLYLSRSLALIGFLTLPYTTYSSELQGEYKTETSVQNKTNLFPLEIQQQLQWDTEKIANAKKIKLQKEGKKNVFVTSFATKALKKDVADDFTITSFFYYEEKNTNSKNPHLVLRIFDYLIKKKCQYIFSFYATGKVCQAGCLFLTHFLLHPKAKSTFMIHQSAHTSTSDSLQKGCHAHPKIDSDEIFPYYLLMSSQLEGLSQEKKNDIRKKLGFLPQKTVLAKSKAFSDAKKGIFTTLFHYLKNYPNTLTIKDKIGLVRICAKKKGGILLLDALYKAMSPKEKKIALNSRYAQKIELYDDHTPIMLSVLFKQPKTLNYLYQCKEVDLTLKNNEGQNLIALLFAFNQLQFLQQVVIENKMRITQKEYNYFNRTSVAGKKDTLLFLKGRVISKKQKHKKPQNNKRKKKKRR